MSRKKGEKKPGRSPSDRKPVRPKRQVRENEMPNIGSLPEDEIRQELASVGLENRIEVPPVREEEKRSSEGARPQVPAPREAPVTPAWFFVDLWAGILTEPYFFWAEVMKGTLAGTQRRV